MIEWKNKKIFISFLSSILFSVWIKINKTYLKRIVFYSTILRLFNTRLCKHFVLHLCAACVNLFVIANKLNYVFWKLKNKKRNFFIILMRKIFHKNISFLLSFFSHVILVLFFMFFSFRFYIIISTFQMRFLNTKLICFGVKMRQFKEKRIFIRNLFA